MARRVIQFPVRNAFAAQRSHDALAREEEEQTSQDHAHRIAQQVENEIARIAERRATGQCTEFEAARNRLQPASRMTQFRKRLASKLFTQS